MMCYSERYINPPYDDWNERGKPTLINHTIYEICRNIVEKGEKSKFSDAFELLYEYVEENINKFIPDEY